ncbi:MAG: DUF1816 domain-containing protein [Jaaginema sp. PMC 1079.18]|nr:DUF1816 domain-containing protein [Jaaginema sp. PMC 1080.18]MEC4849995.1 DUF1816 domain-containing protein [Jaaginema sp. PMC 1079.18]MEC4866489.1 DUF1816 domain-containing protein [Jaaginema sp. PMC 1078.18]
MKEMLIEILDFFGWAYWVKIETKSPECIYYFGPFLSLTEAKAANGGYIEDIKNEGADIVGVSFERTQPKQLTIFDDMGEMFDRERFSTLSGQWS